MRRLTAISLFSLLALLFGMAVGSGSALAKSRPAGHVYVNNNTAGANTISAFDRMADGTLSPIAGSPFATGGAGTGAVTGSQGALQVSDDGKYLLAVNAGSNDISVIQIRPDGSLRALPRTPTPSGGERPLSIAVHRDLVYVANAGPGGRNYTGFTLNSGGQLRPIKDSTIALNGPAAPVDIFFNSTGTLLGATRFGPGDVPSLIDSFAVDGDGLLTASPGSPFTAEGLGPFGSAFRPSNPSQLFVTNAHNGANLGNVSAFDVDQAGVLTSITGSPFANMQSGTCWIEVSPDGSYVFAVNTGTASISRYSVAANGSLTLLGNTPMANPGPGGLGPFDARLTPDGDYLYIVDNSGRVSAFAVSGGSLTEIPSSPLALPTGVTPFGIVVN